MAKVWHERCVKYLFLCFIVERNDILQNIFFCAHKGLEQLESE